MVEKERERAREREREIIIMEDKSLSRNTPVVTMLSLCMAHTLAIRPKFDLGGKAWYCLQKEFLLHIHNIPASIINTENISS